MHKLIVARHSIIYQFIVIDRVLLYSIDNELWNAYYLFDDDELASLDDAWEKIKTMLIDDGFSFIRIE